MAGEAQDIETQTAQIAPTAQTTAVLPTAVLAVLSDSYLKVSLVEKEKDALKGLLALKNTGNVPSNTTENVIQINSHDVHDTPKPPTRKRLYKATKRTHICVDGTLMMFQIHDCRSCRPENFCVKHRTREGFPRINDCSVCHPEKAAEKKRKIVRCGHCNVTCKNPDCKGCARKYNCRKCSPSKTSNQQAPEAGV